MKNPIVPLTYLLAAVLWFAVGCNVTVTNATSERKDKAYKEGYNLGVKRETEAKNPYENNSFTLSREWVKGFNQGLLDNKIKAEPTEKGTK